MVSVFDPAVVARLAPELLKRSPLGVRVKVPAKLGAITTTGAEIPPEQVGLTEAQVSRIWAAATVLFRTGLHPALSLVVRRRGQVIVDRSLGFETPDGEAMTSASPACLFSMSKAITALVVHSVAEDALIDLDAPVATYVPEFAAQGKGEITVRDVLSHRAGLASPPVEIEDIDDLIDREVMMKALCAAKPKKVGTQAYHAVTGGFILGEVAQRATDTSLPDLLAERLAKPMGLPTLKYAAHADDRVAVSQATGPRYLPGASELVNRLLGVDSNKIVPALATPHGLAAVVPAASAYASAGECAAIFQMLLDGGLYRGERILAGSTVADLRRQGGPKVIDGSFPVPIRFSAGMMLGEQGFNLFGRGTPTAFGHLGFSNILCWADPEREISAALLTTGKSIAVEGVLGLLNTSGAIAALPRASARASTT